MSTLYDTLGVNKSASDDEIKKAYRKLARKHHPDANPGDKDAEERFKEVQTAYDVLADPEKRKQYDRFGTQNGRPGPAGGPNVDFGNFDLGDLGDIFGGIFGGGGGRTRTRASRQPMRGNDVEAQVHLSFEDSLHGVDAKVPVEMMTACRSPRSTSGAATTSSSRCLCRTRRPGSATRSRCRRRTGRCR